MQKFNVNIAVCGKFHYTNYVRYMHQFGVLNKFYYSHKIGLNALAIGIGWNTAVNAFVKEYLAVAHEKLLGVDSKMKYITHYHKYWERTVISKYVSANILHLLNHGTALNFIDKHKADKALILGEALNSHPLSMNHLLQQEHEYLGIKEEICLHITQQKMLQEIPKFNYLLAPSNFVKDSYIKHGFNPNDIFTIPFGVNTTKFFKNVPNTPNRSKFRVIYVAQIIPRKGHIYLLKAWKILNLPNAELVFIGSLSPQMKPILAPFKDCFTHLGILNQQQIINELSTANVFVMPSLEEGCAYAPIEAMSCGVPVILSTNTGTAEMITDGKEGYVIPIRNVDAIAEKILTLYKNSELNILMGYNARNLVATTSDWSHYAQRLLKVYQHIMTANPQF